MGKIKKHLLSIKRPLKSKYNALRYDGIWRNNLTGIALGILLLFCTQMFVSAKTLLEQYLNCDGFEEFAFYVEHPEYPEVPIFYRSGSFQGENFLLLTSNVKMVSIPNCLSTNLPIQACARFENIWWAFNTDDFYERKVWEDKGIPEEMNNDIKVYGEDCIRIIRDYLLNLGLEHSNFKLEKDGGVYTNLQTQIKVDYTITKWTEFGMPEEIVANTVDMEGGNLPVTWRNIIGYTENNENVWVPNSITRYANRKSLSEDGKEILLNRIVIMKLIPAKKKLSDDSFLRLQFTVMQGFSPAMTYYLHTNKYIGFDSKSNEVVRLKPDDPRILKRPSRKKLIWGYWISAVLITAGAVVGFISIKRNKSDNEVSIANK